MTAVDCAPLELEARWLRAPDVASDVRRVWRCIRRLAPEWLCGDDRKLATESDLQREVAGSMLPVPGGRSAQVKVRSDAAEAIVTVVSAQDDPLTTWLPSSLIVYVRLDDLGGRAGALQFLRFAADALDCAWACIGADVRSRRADLDSGVFTGGPAIGWASYVSKDEYDLEGLQQAFAAAAVRLERTKQGALAWIDAPWVNEDPLAVAAVRSVEAVWKERFVVAKTILLALERLGEDD